MIKLALFARLEPKPGKERGVSDFLETGWFALKLSPTTFGVFDAFENEAGRQAHVQGPIAQALTARAEDVFSSPPSIEPIDVLGFKNQA